MHQEKQSLKSYVGKKADSDQLMAECKHLIATWKEQDEAAVWYEKRLQNAWQRGVSEVADMGCTYQPLCKSNIKANAKALTMSAQERGLKNQGTGTLDLLYRARFQMQVVQKTCRVCKKDHQRLQPARRNRVH